MNGSWSLQYLHLDSCVLFQAIVLLMCSPLASMDILFCLAFQLHDFTYSKALVELEDDSTACRILLVGLSLTNVSCVLIVV